MSHNIIRLPTVINKTGLSRSTIYLRMSKNQFPQSVSLGDRAVGWIEGDIDNWVQLRISVSQNRNDKS